MKHLLSTVIHFFILCGMTCMAQGPALDWAKRMGGGPFNFSGAGAVATDQSGNVYTVGGFEGTVDFDPGPAIFNLTSTATATNATNIFISKLDPDGNFIWAVSFPDNNYEGITSFILDSTGYLYLSGYFVGTADFDPGPGIHNMTAAGTSDIFMLKLSTDADYIWSKQIGEPFQGMLTASLAMGKTGLYITGDFTNTVDFDPGNLVYNLTASGTNVPDFFIAKFDTAANFIWARSMGGPLIDIAQNIAIDTAENIIISGVFLGTTDFDPGPAVYPLTSNGPWDDIFILKLDSAFNFIWAGSVGCDNNEILLGMHLDATGNIYLTGTAVRETDFDPGPGIYNLSTNSNSTDFYICKINSVGSLAWAHMIGGAGSDRSGQFTIDSAQNIYITGFFSGPVDFDPGPGDYTLPGGVYEHGFISKMNSSGNLLWAEDFGNYGQSHGGGVCVRGSNIYGCGNFYQTVDFDPGPGTYNLTPTGGGDIYVLKLSNRPVLPLKLIDFSASQAGKAKVQLLWQTAIEQHTDQFIIERSSDSRIFTAIGSVPAAGNSSTLRDYRYLDIDALQGDNFYRLKMVDKDGLFTYSKIDVVNINGSKLLDVYPNPAANTLYIKTFGEHENATLRIIDASGKFIKQSKLHLNGSQLLPLNIEDLPKGKYTLVLQTDETKEVVSFVKL